MRHRAAGLQIDGVYADLHVVPSLQRLDAIVDRRDRLGGFGKGGFLCARGKAGHCQPSDQHASSGEVIHRYYGTDQPAMARSGCGSDLLVRYGPRTAAPNGLVSSLRATALTWSRVTSSIRSRVSSMLRCSPKFSSLRPMRFIREPESSRPSTSPPHNEPLAIRHSASVIPSRATVSSTSVVTRVTSAKRSGRHAA